MGARDFLLIFVIVIVLVFPIALVTIRFIEVATPLRAIVFALALINAFNQAIFVDFAGSFALVVRAPLRAIVFALALIDAFNQAVFVDFAGSFSTGLQRPLKDGRVC